MTDVSHAPHATKRTIAVNTLVQLISRGFGAGVTFLITVFLARSLGADGYGDFVKITTFVSLFYLAGDFGINAVFLQRKDSWYTLVALRVVLGVTLIFASLAILVFLPQGVIEGYSPLVRFGIICFAPSILFQALITSANAIFQRYLRYDLATFGSIIGSLMTLLGIYIITRQPLGSTGVIFSVLSLLAGSVVTAVIGGVLARRFVLGETRHISWSHARALFISSIPLGLTLVLNLVYFHVDSILLTLTRSTREVGVYGLAYKFFEFPLVIPTFFMNAVYPVMLNATSDKLQETGKTIRRMFRNSFILLFFVSCLLSLILWFAAPYITLIKSDFSESVSALRVLTFGLPLFFVSALVMWTLIAHKRQWILAGIYGVGMMVNIVLNVLFIPRYGYMAAAWITVGSEFVVLVLSGVYLLKYCL